MLKISFLWQIVRLETMDLASESEWHISVATSIFIEPIILSTDHEAA